MSTDKRTLVLDADLSQGVAGLRRFDQEIDKSARGANRIARGLNSAEIEAKRMAAAGKVAEKTLRQQSAEVQHQAALMKITGKEQGRVVVLQQQSLELRRQAALAVGKEAEAVKILRQQELLAARERQKALADRGAAKSAALGGAANQVGAGGLMGLSGPMLGVAAGAAAAAGAIKLVGDQTARLDVIAKGAQKSGLGLQTYQQLAPIAELAGTSIENVSKATLKLDRNLRDVAQGSGLEAKLALKDLGINADELAQADEIERLAMLADAFEGISDEGTKTTLAVELLGKSGAELVPLLNQGRASIEDMAEAMPGIFSAEQVAKAEAYQDALTKLRKSAADTAATIALEMTPAMTKAADSLRLSGEGGKGIGQALGLVIERVTAALGPLIWMVSGAARNVDILFKSFVYLKDAAVELATDGFDEVAKAARGAKEWFDDTWAGERVKELEDYAGELVGMSGGIEDQIPLIGELSDQWRIFSNTVAGVDQGKLFENASSKLVGMVGQAKELASTGGKRTEDLEASVGWSEHMVRLGEAQKLPAAELERLYQAQHMAKVDLYRATKDQAALEKTLRDETVRQAAAASSRRGRGGKSAKSSEAEDLKAQGDVVLKQWSDRLSIIEGEASLLFETSISYADKRHAIAVEALRLEQQVLEATKTKTEAERIANEGRREAIDREIEILDLARQREEQAQQIEFERAAMELRIAGLDREIERNEALGVSVRLLQETRDAQALAYAERYQGEEELRDEQHRQELARIQAVQDREAAHAEQRKALHAAEMARKKAEEQRYAATASAIQGFGSKTLSLAQSVTDASIKDDEKRAKANMRLGGIMAAVTGAVEVVNAVAAYASFNFVQGALHTAAAAVAFVQSGMMLAGVVPGAGSASAGGVSSAGAGASAAAPDQRQTYERPDVPVNAEGLARQRGQYGSQGAANDSGMRLGGTTINAGVIVTNESAHQLGDLADDDKRKWG